MSDGTLLVRANDLSSSMNWPQAEDLDERRKLALCGKLRGRFGYSQYHQLH